MNDDLPLGIGPGLDAIQDLELGQLRDHLGYALRRAQLWIFRDFTRTLSSIDLSPAAFSVLVVIEANPGLPQRAIAQTLDIERAGLVRLLDRLQQAGWIERRAVLKDRRSHALHLSATGAKSLAGAKRLAMRHEAHVRKRFGEARRETLLVLLRELDQVTQSANHCSSNSCG